MPIFHNCIQQSAEWEQLRLGIPTSSEFARLVTPVEQKRSSSWEEYGDRLIAERLLLTPHEHYSSPGMERGQINEAEAVDWYEFDQDVTTQKIGFVTDDAPNWQEDGKATGTMGCSPDRLVGEDGLLEVKCPDKPHIQVRYVRTGRAQRQYMSQLQGQLMITEREWVDIVCWHPVLPRVIVRVYRDKLFIALLGAEIRRVNEWVETEIDKIRTAGYVHVPQAKAALRESLLATLETPS